MSDTPLSWLMMEGLTATTVKWRDKVRAYKRSMARLRVSHGQIVSSVGSSSSSLA